MLGMLAKAGADALLSPGVLEDLSKELDDAAGRYVMELGVDSAIAPVVPKRSADLDEILKLNPEMPTSCGKKDKPGLVWKLVVRTHKESQRGTLMTIECTLSWRREGNVAPASGQDWEASGLDGCWINASYDVGGRRYYTYRKLWAGSSRWDLEVFAPVQPGPVTVIVTVEGLGATVRGETALTVLDWTADELKIFQDNYKIVERHKRSAEEHLKKRVAEGAGAGEIKSIKEELGNWYAQFAGLQMVLESEAAQRATLETALRNGYDKDGHLRTSLAWMCLRQGDLEGYTSYLQPLGPLEEGSYTELAAASILYKNDPQAAWRYAGKLSSLPNWLALIIPPPGEKILK